MHRLGRPSRRPHARPLYLRHEPSHLIISIPKISERLRKREESDDDDEEFEPDDEAEDDEDGDMDSPTLCDMDLDWAADVALEQIMKAVRKAVAPAKES